MTAPVILAATITPFTPDGELDAKALVPYFTWLRDEGLDGAFVCGTTGEFQTLDADERTRAVEAALEVFGSDRVIAHIGSASLHQALPLARRALELGATRLAAITPYFQPAGEQALLRYYAELKQAAGDAELYAYHFEARSGVVVPPEQLGRIAREAGLAGAKVSGKPMADMTAYLAAAPEGFQLLSGSDADYTAFVQAGGAGGVFACAAAAPSVFAALRDAIVAGDQEAIGTADARMRRTVDAIGQGHPAFVKASLAPRFPVTTTCRVAVDDPTEDQLAALRSALDDEGGAAGRD